MTRITVAAALIFCFLVGTSVLAQQRNRTEPKVPEGVTVHRNIAYVTDGHERQKLDLYVPDTGGNLPLII